MRTVAFHTLGCKVNSYETEAIREQFLNLGFVLREFDEPADAYVINTCSVTQIAARKSRQMLHRARKQNPSALIIATGCYAQEDGQAILSDGTVDLVFGINEKSRIAEAVKAALDEQQPMERTLFLDDMTHCISYEEQMITCQGENVRAYVKIQDGCDHFCTYCIIPYLRGRSRSRNKEDVLKEAAGLAASGYREVVITGIDISTYDGGCGEVPGEALGSLLEQIGKIPGIERIRLGSLEAGLITESFVKQIAEIPQICPQFHLSLQSGSASVLKRMNRHYTPAEYLEKCGILRKYFKNPAITTDIIVGFPGETEEEFEETSAFAETVGFSRVHVFKYSRRKGTRADRMQGQLTDAEKSIRSDCLMQVTERQEAAYECALFGSAVSILTEEEVEIEGLSYLIGFTPEYVRIAVPADGNCINTILTVIPERRGMYRKEPVLFGRKAAGQAKA